MVYHELGNGDGLYSARWNNDRNAERGAHVNTGGEVTAGSSGTAPVVDVSAVEIRIAGQNYSSGASGQVTLTENTTQRPRRDLVIARKGSTASNPASFDVLTGEPIDIDLLRRLQNPNQPGGARIDDSGLPIHPAESIPQVPPPAFQGFRSEATALAMVYVPPQTSDSADIADEYITDMRMEGIGVGDVLRPGDAVDELENANRPLDIHAENADRFNGRGYNQAKREGQNAVIHTTIEGNATEAVEFWIPNNWGILIWWLGIKVSGSAAGDVTLQREQSDGTWQTRTGPVAKRFEKNNDGSPVGGWGSSGQSWRYRIRNNDNVARVITVQYHHTIIDHTIDYGYVDG